MKKLLFVSTSRVTLEKTRSNTLKGWISLLAMLCIIPFSQAQITHDITSDEAFKAILAAQEKAKELNITVNIAVVDAGANLKGFIRMDESYLGSIDVAIKKAKTARYFNIATADLGKLTQPGGIIYNIELTNNGLVSFPGGIPIKNKEGKIIGAIGVSGGTIEQDHEIAAFGAMAIN